LATASANDLILFGGGYNNTGYSDRVDIFNATSGEWTTESLSEPRYYLAAASACHQIVRIWWPDTYDFFQKAQNTRGNPDASKMGCIDPIID
jgi:hypothetical protein